MVIDTRRGFTVAKNYRLFAMAYGCDDNDIKSVNSSYFTENMAIAQALFKEDIRNMGMIPLAVMSEAQVRKKVQTGMCKRGAR